MEQSNRSIDKDQALSPIPLSDRQHWITPTTIFGGLEVTIPVLIVGLCEAKSER